ncbi:ATP-dependent helicase [Virgibacillus pantothenticus]|uniref:UvrD-helicase domain-containing protein n=1 Tax=Virgibacillus pantothenticus TaxID=1473 RepID=UPI001C22A7D8|nr:ATP-dependent helicase [Virgibacillus pantothenticus]MBU8567909.1 ATP-dependent helicase [Virgibacillus pantothenticus]MBU8601831.1 ATP-dependent helicase [Virgibacillus pantothenticus]MBU8635985.1 ATP-dependent helicase [Virgibacillus pantothenticus]MBU8643669.1 ATP-dependent helicase [Virgibacillus pantothenticus]MBU8647809.1 ATP-dependent helicase [Virgibacillus pantothenticus]
MITILSSDSIELEQHFKVTAGPGAGKTHWLVNHIKNTINNSFRLEKTRKIACITYTNIAVETIMKRLGTNIANRVEVSTIHSFLYKHVIKSYLFLIADEFGVNVEKVNGHDTISPQRSTVEKWLENHSRKTDLKHPNTVRQLQFIDDKKKSLWVWLSNLEYRFDLIGHLKLVGKREKAGSIIKVVDILEDDLLSYKKLSWARGRIDHDDVLFFSHVLIKKHPFILKVLRAKFPYFFLDEVQDTNPIQTQIIKMIAEEETIVGVIGDPAQSIYAFQGANIEEFNNFQLEKMAEYHILENRRSSNQIIDLLNNVRKDIVQEKYKNVDEDVPILFIGDTIAAYKKIKALYGEDTLIHTLSRDNSTANAMKSMLSLNGIDSKLLIKFKETDSNTDRQKIIINSIESVESARIGDYKNALEKIKVLFTELSEKDQVNKSIALLQELSSKYSNYESKAIREFYNILKPHISMAGFKAGAAKDFYNNNSYKHLSICINFKEDISNHRTIHKAKGDEFENVLLIPNSLDFLINPDLVNDEEHRIYYVGLSRAESRLFIVVPKLLKKHQKLIEEKYKVKVEDLSKLLN